MAGKEMEQFGRDLERVASLARTFFGHREAITQLEELATSRGKDPAEALVMSAAWVGYGMARVWPQGPWQPSAMANLLKGGLEGALGGVPAPPQNKLSGSPKDMPRPPADMLEGLSAEQRRFLSFCFGVLGGISEQRPLEEGPLASIVALAHLLAPLVCIPGEAMLDENTVSEAYIAALAEALELDVDELIALGNRIGLNLL